MKKPIKLPCTQEMLPFGGGRFVCGKSEEMSDKLSSYRGKVSLVYLDPPFCTGDTFRNSEKLCAYNDNSSVDAYLAMIKAVLNEAYALLRDDGSIYVHIDYRMNAHIRLLLDEVFGQKNFLNEIIWTYKSGGRSKKHFARKHDTIYFYKKGKNAYFDIDALGTPRGRERRNNMKFNVDDDGRVFYSIFSAGKLYKYYEDDPMYPTDVWADIEHLHQRDSERVNYPTQKPEELLRRIISASSPSGAIVCDLFSGSGTTASVANRLGRNFLAADSSPLSCSALRKRLIISHASKSLLQEDEPSIFDFEAFAANPPEVFVRLCNGKSNESSLSVLSSESLDQLSLGHVQDGIFYPLTHNLSARKQPTVAIPTDASLPLCLHVITQDGNHGVFSLEI